MDLTTTCEGTHANHAMDVLDVGRAIVPRKLVLNIEAIRLGA